MCYCLHAENSTLIDVNTAWATPDGSWTGAWGDETEGGKGSWRFAANCFFFFFFNFIGYWLLGGLSLRYGVLLVCHACNFMSPNANCTPSETPNP